jgi:hypothetical protein
MDQEGALSMRRFAIAVIATAALMLPAAVVAQDESPEASMGPIGVTTFDVCLAISGPVIELTPEALTQGITDGTFVIEGMSTACEGDTMADPGASEEPMDDLASEEPMDPAASPEAAESDG